MFTNTCPVCGETDQVQNVGALVSEESGVSFNVGAVVGGGGLAPLLMGGVSKSYLARRLSPRKQPPGDVDMLWWLVALILLSIIGGLIAEPIWFPQDPTLPFNIFIFGFMAVVCAVPFFLGGYILALPLAIIFRFSRPNARRRYFDNVSYLSASYYCHRDDVVFDGVNYGAPESYVPFVFRNAR